MHILLIFPRADPRRGTKVKNYMVPPHSLQILAALTPPEHTVVVQDQFHQSIDLGQPADLVGLSVWTASAHNAYQLADAFRARGIPVILGGPHASVCPEEAAQHADAVLVGEAEGCWAQILADADQGCLRQFYRGEPRSLSETPAPRREVLAEARYVLPQAVSTSRGCNFRCEFCYESSRTDSVYRRKPLAEVLAEIDRLPEPVVAFLDNDLLGDKRYARALLEALVPRQKYWMAMTTIRFADDPTLVALAAAAGCRTLFIGFESVSPASLREVNKRQNQVELYARNIQRLHEQGIMVNGSFVFGFDHDTPAIFDTTVRFGIENKLETATFTILTPYPNTGLYRRLTAEGRILDHNWAHYDTTRAVFQPKNMNGAELEAGYFSAYAQFYRLEAILKRVARPGPGWAQRLALNLAYKRIEPLWKSFDWGIPPAWARAMTYWYMRPPRAQLRAMRAFAQARQAPAEGH